MKHPREMSNSELAFALNEAPGFGLEEIKIQREVTKRLLKLEEFERSNAPRDGNILRKDNTTDMEYDATIIQLRSIIMSAERNFECITKMKDISESRRQAKFALRKLRERMGEDRVVIEYGGKRYVRKVDSDRVFDIAEIGGDVFLRLQDANDEKKQTILLKEIKEEDE